MQITEGYIRLNELIAVLWLERWFSGILVYRHTELLVEFHENWDFLFHHFLSGGVNW